MILVVNGISYFSCGLAGFSENTFVNWSERRREREGCKLLLYIYPGIQETHREHSTLTLLAELTDVPRFLLLLDNIFYSSLNACNSPAGLVSALGAALVKVRLPWVLGAARKVLGSSSTNMMKSLFLRVFL